MKNASIELYTEFDAGTQADLAPAADNSVHGSSAASKYAPILMLGHTTKLVGAKTFCKSGDKIVSFSAFPDFYDLAKQFHFEDFDGFAEIMRDLLNVQNYHMVLGELRPGANRKKVRRSSKRNDGDIIQTTSNLLVIDTEAVLLEHTEDPRVDPEDCAATLYSMVVDAAPELDGARCLVQFSSSAGFDEVWKKKQQGKLGFERIDTLRAHMFFLTSEKYTEAQKKAWAARLNENMAAIHSGKLAKEPNGTPSNFADLTVYGPGKVLYTAEPVCIDVRNPIPDGRRIVEIKGDVEEVTLTLPIGAESRSISQRAAARVVRRGKNARFRWPRGHKNVGRIPTVEETREALAIIGNDDILWEHWAIEIGL